ncbi:hypothetical protein, partial [Methylobacterium crusticola]|uniref:hypothetical protein n=1 Tax=Methylobacterium crusticola TaxID=1697972 RepID=UPI001EE357F6
GELIEIRSGDVILLNNVGHVVLDAWMESNVFDNFHTSWRIYIMTSGKRHRIASGRWSMVMNRSDSIV